MIDIEILRKNPEVVIESLKKRRDEEKIGWVKKLIELDEKWREKVREDNRLRRRKNELVEEIARRKKEGKGVKVLIRESKGIEIKIEENEKEMRELQKQIEYYLLRMPNILHESVPCGEDESDNVPIRFWGKPLVWKEHLEEFKRQGGKRAKVVKWKPLDHQDLADKLGLIDVKRAAKVAGSRFYYLRKELVILDLALQRFAMDFLVKKGFTPIEPPFMLRRKAEEGVTSFEDFEEMLYKIEGEDLYLIPTSEHPIAAMHMDEVLNPKNLPLKYAGISPCFRKEAGSHGRDTKGIFRVHQFNKVEQFVFCKPEESWDWFERLIKNAEEIFRKLRIPYRVVNICTGDIGMVAAKKYDLEAWLPGQGKYREMVSCSNCTEWQSRRLNIRYFLPTGERKYVHTLNSTAIATGRAIIAIMENFQRKDGSIKIPKVLHKYAGFKRIGLKRD